MRDVGVFSKKSSINNAEINLYQYLYASLGSLSH